MEIQALATARLHIYAQHCTLPSLSGLAQAAYGHSKQKLPELALSWEVLMTLCFPRPPRVFGQRSTYRGALGKTLTVWEFLKADPFWLVFKGKPKDATFRGD